MKLTAKDWLRSAWRVSVCAGSVWLAAMAAQAQAVITTTVQGTVYAANGQPAGGTLVVSWPTFTTAAGQLISAGQSTVTVGADGFVSVNLAPNQGATPAGEYYTAVFYKSDGTVSTQYWVVPAATQASLAAVEAQIMPAAQAVQAVSKAYVDQTVSQALGSQLSASGGNLTGPLFLSSDPTQPLQAADKNYVDSSVSSALPLSGGTVTGPATFNAAVTFSSGVTATAPITFSGIAATQTLTNLLPGVTADGSNGETVAGNVTPNASVTKLSPEIDVRAYGAKVDGSTDVGSPISSAIAACNAANGNSCTVLLPCAGPNGCYLANGSGIRYSGSDVLHLKLQGTLHLGSTLVLPNNLTLTCDGGAQPQSFQYSGATCAIIGPNVNGTVGTAITTTGTPVTFTPTFTSGSASDFAINSDITVAGVQSCSATASRTSSGSTSPNTVFTLSGCMDSSGNTEGPRTPVGSVITVTGCSDSTFNIAGAPVNGQDWPNNTESIYETGATSTATGCTVVGFDDNTLDTVSISAVSGGTMTATFAHKHAASDLFGMGAVTFQEGLMGHHDLQGVAISSQGGTALWLDNVAENNLSDDGFRAAFGKITSIAVECAGCWQGDWNKDTFAPLASFQCYSSCASSYPFSIRFTQDSTHQNGVGGTFTQISNSNIQGGVKIDGNGMNNSNGVGPELGPFVNDVFEQSALGAITVDPRIYYAGPISISMNYSSLQDDFIGNTSSFVAGTDCCVSGFANLGDLISFTASVPSVLNNKYWPQGVMANNAGESVNPASTGISTGVLTSGDTLLGNFAGANAGFFPSIVPQATLPVTDPVTCATCSTVTGPDGVANTALEIKTTSGGTWADVTVGSMSVSTYPGDIVIFGAECSPGTGQTEWGGFWGTNRLFALLTGGTDTFVTNPNVSSNTVFGGGLIPLTNGTWQKCISIAQIATGESTAHFLNFNLYSPAAGTANVGNRYYDWFWMYVPGPNNPAYAGVTQQEAVRWAEEVLKGYVPSSGSTGSLYINPAYKLSWGTATDLYPSPLGNVKSDEGMDAASYAVGGASGNGGQYLTSLGGASRWSYGTAQIASGVTQLGTTAIPSGTAAFVIAIPATGVRSTDVVDWNFSTSPASVAGYGPAAGGSLTVYAYPTTGNVNFLVQNSTAGGITPGAISVNWHVNRSSAVPSLSQITFVPETSSTPTASITSSSFSVVSGEQILAVCSAGAASTSIAISTSVSSTQVGSTGFMNSSPFGIAISEEVLTFNASGSTTVTCTPSASAGNQSMVIGQITGLSVTGEDGSPIVNNPFHTTTYTSSSWSTSGEALSFLCVRANSNTGTLSPGTIAASAAGMNLFTGATPKADVACEGYTLPAGVSGVTSTMNYSNAAQGFAGVAASFDY